MKKNIKFIDLFAGLGGTRIGFENACKKHGLQGRCVFTSEIKKSAIDTYIENFEEAKIHGDISKIEISEIPDFDYLLAGFPCQPFSAAGKRLGFYDTRGTLFFNIERIIKEKKPKGFLLENVEGLASHDGGETLKIIISNLENLGYKTSYKIIDSSLHGVPQKRKRTYIVGRMDRYVDLDRMSNSTKVLEEVLERDKNLLETDFTKKLFKKFKPSELYGKSIKDKRGGNNNIHSWDLEIKGSINKQQKWLLDKILRERRKKHWAGKKGIKWMDGMPLTLKEIESFVNDLFHFNINIKKELDDLVQKGYLTFEHPKKIIRKKIRDGYTSERIQDVTIEKGYNIVAGKLSFEISKILDPKNIAPTIVATDASRLAVIDGEGIRRLTVREGLRLFGFPEWYKINQQYSKAYDLLGNSVVVPVIAKVAERLLL